MHSLENMRSEFSKIDRLTIRNIALARAGNFWLGREAQLEVNIERIILEIQDLEEAAGAMNLPLSFDETKKIKAIWVISGAGTYFQPITNTAGDLIYKDKAWAHFSDHDRISYASEIVKKIGLLASAKSLPGPYLIYDGIEEQNEDLISAVESHEIMIPKSALFIPKGRILKTLDQVKYFELPADLNIQNGDVIGVVSHAPHLARVMRMVNKYKPFPKGVKVKLLPLVFTGNKNEKEFAQAEITGILDYISKGEATEESYPYEL